jgi:transketolase
MSDGECNEGSVWEAALFAAAQELENLTLVIYFNRWQATGRSTDVLALEPLTEKWRAFGWAVEEVDGHDTEALAVALRRAPYAAGRPTALVAHTVKGKGVSFMEDDNNWHYRIPNKAEFEAALAELPTF